MKAHQTQDFEAYSNKELFMLMKNLFIEVVEQPQSQKRDNAAVDLPALVNQMKLRSLLQQSLQVLRKDKEIQRIVFRRIYKRFTSVMRDSVNNNGLDLKLAKELALKNIDRTSKLPVDKFFELSFELFILRTYAPEFKITQDHLDMMGGSWFTFECIYGIEKINNLDGDKLIRSVPNRLALVEVVLKACYEYAAKNVKKI